MRSFLILTSLLILLAQNCSYIKGCKSKCKDKTRNCVLQNQLFRVTTTAFVSQSGQTRRTVNSTEQEPNNTFLQNFQNAENALSVNQTFILNFSATISSASDIDIFSFSSSDDPAYSIRYTQNTGSDLVNCILYEKLNVPESSSKLQSDTTVPTDPLFINKGKLTVTYIPPASSFAYIVCSGPINTNYSFQVETFDSGTTRNSPSPATNFINGYTTLTTLINCPGATEQCEKQCSK